MVVGSCCSGCFLLRSRSWSFLVAGRSHSASAVAARWEMMLTTTAMAMYRNDMLRSIIVDRWRTCCFALSSSSLSAATAADDDDADSVIIHCCHHDDNKAARVLKRCALKGGCQQQSTCAMALSHAINGRFRDCVVVVAVVSILWLRLVVEVAPPCSVVAWWLLRLRRGCCGCAVVAAVAL